MSLSALWRGERRRKASSGSATIRHQLSSRLQPVFFPLFPWTAQDGRGILELSTPAVLVTGPPAMDSRPSALGELSQRSRHQCGGVEGRLSPHDGEGTKRRRVWGKIGVSPRASPQQAKKFCANSWQTSSSPPSPVTHPSFLSPPSPSQTLHSPPDPALASAATCANRHNATTGHQPASSSLRMGLLGRQKSIDRRARAALERGVAYTTFASAIVRARQLVQSASMCELSPAGDGRQRCPAGFPIPEHDAEMANARQHSPKHVMRNHTERHRGVDRRFTATTAACQQGGLGLSLNPVIGKRTQCPLLT